jgi:hypothetical protein
MNSWLNRSNCEWVFVFLHLFCAVFLSSVACQAVPYFSTVSHDTITGKKFLNMNICSDFLYKFETFPISRKIERDIINLRRFSCKFYSCQILIKLEFSRNIFKKYSDIGFRKNPSSGRIVVPRGKTDVRTDGQT